MAVDDIDFGNGDPIDINTPQEPKEPKEPQEPQEPKEPKEPIPPAEPQEPKEPKEPKEPQEPSGVGELNAGDTIEFEGATYTVAENGDILDKDGKVFKEQKDVADWLKELEVPEDDGITIDAIREAFPEEVVDDKGNPVEFENTIEGVKSYINTIVENKVKGAEEAAINTLYANNPLLKQFKDYVDVTGSYEGFGQLPDREDWEIDKENEAQQEAIIKMAAQEFGNKTINNAYIEYLKTSGSLYDYAVEMLDSLKEKDKELRDDIAKKAEENRKQEQQKVTEYWNKVNNIIKNKTIAGYKLPDSVQKEIDGKKVILTPNDFFDYLYKQVHTNANGQKISAYQKALEEMSEEDYINNELINAWLLFTGGSFKDLANMAVKENQVRILKLASKQHKSPSTIKVNKKPSTSKVNPDDILF